MSRRKTRLFAVVALLAATIATCVPAAEAGEEQVAVAADPYRAALASEAYSSATAHAPHFDDPTLWPAEDVKQAAYARQTWPQGRLMIWAKPGVSSRGNDGADPKYWIEDGKPATKPFEENTDLVLPACEARRYWVVLQGRKYQAAPCRHVTIGKNAGLVWQHSSRGNTWIKEGGSLQYLDSFVDNTHAFCRNDNEKPISLVDHLYIQKTSGASVEFIGAFTSDDELSVHSGTMLLAPGSEFGAGDRTTVGVLPKGQLVLLSGAYLHRRNNCDWGRDIVVSGALLAGTPDRPLTRDCRIGLSYKSKGVFVGPKRDDRMPGPDDYGLVVAPEGSLSVHSANPRIARLVLNCPGLDHDAQQVRILGDKIGRGDVLLSQLKTLPRRIDMLLLGKVDLDGVLFEDVLKGGILLPDPAVRSQWKNVFYGGNNGGQPAELYRHWEGKVEQHP